MFQLHRRCFRITGKLSSTYSGFILFFHIFNSRLISSSMHSIRVGDSLSKFQVFNFVPTPLASSHPHDVFSKEFRNILYNFPAKCYVFRLPSFFGLVSVCVRVLVCGRGFLRFLKNHFLLCAALSSLSSREFLVLASIWVRDELQNDENREKNAKS